jgi:hypothetical protein
MKGRAPEGRPAVDAGAAAPEASTAPTAGWADGPLVGEPEAPAAASGSPAFFVAVGPVDTRISSGTQNISRTATPNAMWPRDRRRGGSWNGSDELVNAMVVRPPRIGVPLRQIGIPER